MQNARVKQVHSNPGFRPRRATEFAIGTLLAVLYAGCAAEVDGLDELEQLDEPDIESTEQAITNGSSPTQYQHPWVAQVHYPSCSAVIVHPGFVVTSARCAEQFDGDTLVRSGNYLNTTAEREQFRSVKTVTVHPDYSGRGSLHDIAVVELNVPFDIQENTQIIALPTSTTLPARARFAAYGKYTAGNPFVEIQHADFDIVDIDECISSGTRNLCAKNSAPTPAAMSAGDSGGPLMTGSARIQLLGIASSYGGEPGEIVFAKASSYASFIRNTIGQNLLGNVRMRSSGDLVRGTITLFCPNVLSQVASTLTRGAELSCDAVGRSVTAQCKLETLNVPEATITSFKRIVNGALSELIATSGTSARDTYTPQVGEVVSWQCAVDKI